MFGERIGGCLNTVKPTPFFPFPAACTSTKTRLRPLLGVLLIGLPIVVDLSAAETSIKGKGAFSQIVPASAVQAAAAKPVSASQLIPLTSGEAAKSFDVSDGLIWEQVLAEPIVAQPLFLTFDERGRMWVVQYRQYPNPAGLKMVSRDNFWRAVYDKVPPPPPNHFKGADRITIHEDRDANGHFETHKTFVDGLNIATSVALGRGGVFVLNPPYLLFYPDRDRDDVPDGDPQLLLSGFGLEDTHSVANSLRWGPDGWLYGCQGSTVVANILVHGPDGKPLPGKPAYSQGQNVWRYHPENRIYEVFSEWGGNAFGLEIDSQGRIFSGHNGGNTRGFHYQQGAYLQKGFDKHGPLSNPYAFGYFPQMAHNDADRFTHNFVIYDSGALGEAYEGRLFGVEPLQGRLVLSEITSQGSTFRTRDLGYPVTSEDKWFRPVDIKLGPEGALYVCDWYDRQVNHYRNHEGQMDGSNGRIYRLRSAKTPVGSVGDLANLAGDQLLRLLGHTNRWWRSEALRVIADRKGDSWEINFAGIIRSADERTVLEALWALHQLGRLDDATAALALSQGSASVRRWVVQLLGDAKRLPRGLRLKILELAARERDIEVRAQLASTAKRLAAVDGLALVKELLTHDRDADDARQPLMLWWAIEEKCATDREEVVALFSDRELWSSPLVQGHLLSRLMRRFAATGRREDLMTCSRLFAMSPGPIQTARLTQGFEEAFKGRPLVGLPEELLLAMERAGGESVIIGARRGKADAVTKALEMIADRGVDGSRRLQLIQVFGESRQAKAVPILLSVARDEKSSELRRAALSALQAYDNPEIAVEVTSQLAGYPPDVRNGALTMLTSRGGWALTLLEAVQAGRVPKAAIPSDMVRRVQGIESAAHRAELQKTLTALWPSFRQPTSAELEKEIVRLTGVIEATTGSPYAGKRLFVDNCGVCHKLFNVGAIIGPDLTTYKRDDLGNMLLNIVNPNAEIREGYENFLIETKDERTLTGFLVDKDAQVVVLRGADGQSIAVPQAEIVNMQPAGASLMPDGLISTMSDQQVRDLFAFLRSTQPLPE